MQKHNDVTIQIKVTRNGVVTRYKKSLKPGEAVIGRIAGVAIKAQEDEDLQSQANNPAHGA